MSQAHGHELLAYVASELGSQARETLAWLKHLPLDVTIASLEGQIAAHGSALHLLYLTEPVIEKHGQRIEQIFGRLNQELVLCIALEPLDRGQTLLPPSCQFELVSVYGLTDSHACVRLAQAVLRRLDLQFERGTADGWERGTELLPESLLLRCGDREHRIPPDYGGLFTIGRGQSSQLRIDSNYASRLHGCFRVSEGTFTYRDMSSNGTRLQVGHNERIVHDEEIALKRPGILRIGGVEIHFSTSAL
ncbi:MAG: FHA domain-containing protein [Pseudomonadota bacterium]